MTVYDDEIDLRPYILALIHHRWQIALITILAAGIAFTVSFTQTRNYQATATILLTRTRTTLSLAQQFPTVSEPTDNASRMNAMLSIAQSDSIASDTLQALGSSIPAEDRDLTKFKDRVKVSNNGDLIQIVASADDPELATKIANEWAQQTVTAINLAFSGEQPLSTIQAKLQSSQQEYETAQSNLEDFVKNNQIDILNKQIAEAKSLFSQQADERTQQILYYSNRKQAMDDLIVKANALKQELQTGGRSSAGSLGDALAVLIARMNALGISPSQANNSSTDPNPGNVSLSGSTTNQISQGTGMLLNLQISDLNALQDSAQNYSADLDTIINISTQEKTKSQEELDSLAQEVYQKQGYEGFKDIAAQIRDLETELESEQARQKELTSQRDLAWQAYQAIAQKQVEIVNAPQTSNQVTLASLAVTPQKPASRGTVRNTLVAVVLGLMLGVFWVVGMQWWRAANILASEDGTAAAGEHPEV
jgi:capsular polysaccharide biosynthesis protein